MRREDPNIFNGRGPEEGESDKGKKNIKEANAWMGSGMTGVSIHGGEAKKKNKGRRGKVVPTQK